jgi:hypothetical protein
VPIISHRIHDMPARTRIVLPLAFVLGVASATFAAPAGAQSATLVPQATATLAPPVNTPVAPQPTAERAPAGPSIDAAAVGVRHAPADAPAQARRGGYGQPVALMVVGGAAVLVGLIIGGGAGTAIAIGGAVAGLVGLYQYLQ